jgi:hypothetical protein
MYVAIAEHMQYSDETYATSEETLPNISVNICNNQI